MTSEDIEELLVTLEGAANMMRGMLFDDSIPRIAKHALRAKIKEIESIAEKHQE